jgi:hypothetical protein
VKLYSDTLNLHDVRAAFRTVRDRYGADIWDDGSRSFRPRNRYQNGVEFYAHSMDGNVPTGHRPIGSYSLDYVQRAASWDDYGWLIAYLFTQDPDARIGCYDGVQDFISQVEQNAPHRKSSAAFLELVKEYLVTEAT